MKIFMLILLCLIILPFQNCRLTVPADTIIPWDYPTAPGTRTTVLGPLSDFDKIAFTIYDYAYGIDDPVVQAAIRDPQTGEPVTVVPQPVPPGPPSYNYSYIYNIYSDPKNIILNSGNNPAVIPLKAQFVSDFKNLWAQAKVCHTTIRLSPGEQVCMAISMPYAQLSGPSGANMELTGYPMCTQDYFELCDPADRISLDLLLGQVADGSAFDYQRTPSGTAGP